MALRTPVLDGLEARVVEHPWLAVGLAFALGSWLALERDEPRVRAARAIVASLARSVTRDLAVRRLATLRNELRAGA